MNPTTKFWVNPMSGSARTCRNLWKPPKINEEGGMDRQTDEQGHSNFVNTLRPRQNGRHFTDDTFKHIFLNENVRISIKISLKFVPKGPINNISALVHIMAWRRPGDKPLSEPMRVTLLMQMRHSASMS